MKARVARYIYTLLILGSTSLATLHAQSISYTTFSVPEAAPGTPGSLSVNGINKSGVIVGSLIDTSSNVEGWMRDPTTGAITLLVDPLDTSTPTATTAYGINNAGIITGYFYDTAVNNFYGYFYKNGNYKTYSVPGQPIGTQSVVSGINNKGQFCGFIIPPPFTTISAFVNINGVVTVFDVSGASFTECGNINDSGEAAGVYGDAAGIQHGWMRDPTTGALTTFDVPGAVQVLGNVPCAGTVAGTVALGINNKGYISGHYWDSSYNEHGFIRTPTGKYVTLDVPGAYQTAGGGINSAGTVVGHWSDTSCDNFGFIATPN